MLNHHIVAVQDMTVALRVAGYKTPVQEEATDADAECVMVNLIGEVSPKDSNISLFGTRPKLLLGLLISSSARHRQKGEFSYAVSHLQDLLKAYVSWQLKKIVVAKVGAFPTLKRAVKTAPE